MSQPITYPCISLHQPWASLLVMGAPLGKTNETRSWHPEKFGWKVLGKTIAIHAAKKWTGEQEELCGREHFREALASIGITDPRRQLERGGVVGLVDFVRCDKILPGKYEIPAYPERAFGDYTFGRFAWKTANPRRLQYAMAETGRQGFWQWKPTHALPPIVIPDLATAAVA